MINSSFTVSFKFEGGLADAGELDGSDHETSIGASRRLLALNAHCFLTGKVPSAAYSKGTNYHIRHVASRHGSHEDIWNVFMMGVAVQIVGGVVANAYANEVKAGVQSAAQFFRHSIQAVVGRAPRSLPEFVRVEPTLPWFDGNRGPMIDAEPDIELERARLHAATAKVLHEVARPVGRSANKLTVLLNSEPIAEIDIAQKQRLLADQISEVITSMRGNTRANTTAAF